MQQRCFWSVVLALAVRWILPSEDPAVVGAIAPWVIPLIMAAAQGGGQAASALSAGRQSRNQMQMSQEQIDAERGMQALEIALKESEMNPFRHQLAQAGSLASLDQMERGTRTPISVTGAAPYASYKPQVQGGYSYEKSPELVASAGALKRDVMAGNRAPSVVPSSLTTNYPVVGSPNATQRVPPANQQSAVLDLISALFPDDPLARARKPQKPGGPMGPTELDTFGNTVKRPKQLPRTPYLA
jgi:hypothetical protein